ncbi:MAG: hypothetical protein N3I86_06255 [Verrucomicrobiae bacterium]|nr:hypothetical protein [Verrucomicrobiae bacterium]MDW8308871.1 hypothetical protein [Verrucomicrobiales bacterium]
MRIVLMPDASPKAELLRSLGRLARGLSALFWGLPAWLIVAVRTARAEWLAPWAVLPLLALGGVLLFGLWQMSAFQPQERPWRAALDRAKLLGLVNLGLSPFLYWWNRIHALPADQTPPPVQWFFAVSVALLALNGVLFLFNLNIVLERLGAMLPDETLRSDTRQFTAVNRLLLLALLVVAALQRVRNQLPDLPHALSMLPAGLNGGVDWAQLLLLLLPLSMTMALIWKAKEAILQSAFGGRT